MNRMVGKRLNVLLSLMVFQRYLVKGERIDQNERKDLLPCFMFKLFWASFRLEHNLLIILCLDGDIIVSQW